MAPKVALTAPPEICALAPAVELPEEPDAPSPPLPPVLPPPLLLELLPVVDVLLPVVVEPPPL